MAPALLGVDIGGTFTDLVCWRDGRLTTYKLPSTPDDYSRAVVDGLARLGGDAAAVTHGSTVATNAILERRGARCALLTTAGFRDVLAIGRQNRPSLYDLDQPVPEPLVPRGLRREVTERIAPDGTILIPLEPDALEEVLAGLDGEHIEALAICFLFSFVRPDHERLAAERARARGWHVSVSSEILPEFREFERTATTVLNAYVGPVMSRYLTRLQGALGGTPLRIMQSNGGCIDAATAGREAVRTVLSGPAAGVVGACGVARVAGFEQMVTFDMGGTSTDVAVCAGRLPLTTETSFAGLPIGVPVLDIQTVGAGGGSLARCDSGGALTVGPESAGAAPGPACYGRGGTLPTVTDANLVLGRLVPDRFLGGRMRLDPDRAREAVDRLAAELGTDPLACARGIVRVAEAAIERAIRVISVERGLDPRRLALVSFGGAGGLHACSLARALGLSPVIVPPHPGALSALGLLMADLVRDGARTVMTGLDELTAEQLESWLAELAEREAAALQSQGLTALRVEPLLDLRYRGQSYELTRPCSEPRLEAVAADFHAAHEERYGYRRDEAPIELVTLRVRVTATVDKPSLEPQAMGTPEPAEAQRGRIRCVLEQDEPRNAELYDLERLRPGMRLRGPALLAGEDSTVLVPSDYAGEVDAWGNLVLRPVVRG